MKRILSVIIAILTVLSLAACAANVEPDKSASPAQSTQAGKSETAAPTEESAATASEPSAEPVSTASAEASESVPSNEPTEEPETSEPTPLTPEQLLEKKRNNTALKTEDDIDVIHVGTYEFTLPDGRKLAYDEKGVISAVDPHENTMTSFLVSFQNSGKDKTGRKGVRYVIYAGDSVKKSMKDGSSKVTFVSQDDHSMNTNWFIEEHEDGTVSLRCVGTKRYLMMDNKGNFKSDYAATDKEIKNFGMKLVKEGTSVFHQSISEKGNIIIRISDDVKRDGKLTYERQAKFANDLQCAYETYWDLTDYQVWESIVARIYEPEAYFGYIIADWNVISFNLQNAVDDLKKMAYRWRNGEINDWNFCMLHEMGHMFDAYRGWKFDGEFATDLKVAYVLYANSDVDARAATAGFTAKICFNGDEFNDMWVGGKTPMTKEFNFDRQLCLFVTYCRNIGWDNVKKAYHEIQHMQTQETVPIKMYQLFTKTLQKYAPNGEHVEDLMQPGELDVLLANLRK